MTNQGYIFAHKDDDIRSLALKKVPEGVDALWCLTQIEGYQLAKKKLPRWTATEGLIYPPRLSMEQCSSELTAEYKAHVVKRLHTTGQLRPISLEGKGGGSIIDLTGGFGVDFSYMARYCKRAIYVERQKALCDAARNNFPLMDLPQAEVWNMSAEEALDKIAHIDIINIDPARRDNSGRKVAAISDCTPNLLEIQDKILDKADYVFVKLSPMLDITQALRELHCVNEVHIISVKNECKELLFVLSKQKQSVRYYCVNLDTQETDFVTTSKDASVTFETPKAGMLLFEPNVSILKAGMQDSFAAMYDLKKLHPMSHLYITEGAKADIPGRIFHIKEVLDFSKSSIKKLHQELTSSLRGSTGGRPQANITIRNFPSTVADLRKRLKVEEGGNEYLFATTLIDGSHAILRCENYKLKRSSC